MPRKKPEEQPLGIRSLIGVGFDGDDGHTRISRGPNFYLHGGSETTHEKMQHVALSLNDKVDRRGKKLEEINKRELDEIVDEIHEQDT